MFRICLAVLLIVISSIIVSELYSDKTSESFIIAFGIALGGSILIKVNNKYDKDREFLKKLLMTIAVFIGFLSISLATVAVGIFLFINYPIALITFTVFSIAILILSTCE